MDNKQELMIIYNLHYYMILIIYYILLLISFIITCFCACIVPVWVKLPNAINK